MAERLPISRFNRALLRKVALRNIEFDIYNYLSRDVCRYEHDFIGGAGTTLDTEITTGGAGTAAALVSGRVNGEADLVTGNVDNQCSTIFLANGNYLGNKNCVIQARIYVSSIATGNAMVGFTDSAAAGILGATGVGPFVSPLASPPTLTGAAADAVALTYDLSSALASKATWNLAYSQTSVAALIAGTIAPAVTQATAQWLTVQIYRSPHTANDCGVRAFVNEVLVGEVHSAAITGNVALWPFVLIGATSGTGRTLSIDAIRVYQDRDVAI